MRIYRILILNNQTVAIANGVVITIEIRRITATTGGTVITPIKHDNNSANLSAHIVAATGATDTVASDILKTFYGLQMNQQQLHQPLMNGNVLLYLIWFGIQVMQKLI